MGKDIILLDWAEGAEDVYKRQRSFGRSRPLNRSLRALGAVVSIDFAQATQDVDEMCIRDSNCTTAISDDEAEYKDEKGHLWHLRYPLTER